MVESSLLKLRFIRIVLPINVVSTICAPAVTAKTSAKNIIKYFILFDLVIQYTIQNQAGQPTASDFSSAASAWGLSGGNTSPLTTTTRVPTGITVLHIAHLLGRCNRVLYARLCGHCSLNTIAHKVSKCFLS